MASGRTSPTARTRRADPGVARCGRGTLARAADRDRRRAPHRLHGGPGTRMTVDELCERHRRVAFDANVFVYLFESTGHLAAAAIAVVNAVSARRLTGVVSSVVLAEVIVRPVRIGDDTMGERFADAIRSIENLHVVPVTPRDRRRGRVRPRSDQPHPGRRSARRDCAGGGCHRVRHERPAAPLHAQGRGCPARRPHCLTVAHRVRRAGAPVTSRATPRRHRRQVREPGQSGCQRRPRSRKHGRGPAGAAVLFRSRTATRSQR